MRARALIGLAGMMTTLGVLVASNWSAARAQPVANMSLPPPGAAKPLYPGCNNVALSFADGTSSANVFEAISPPGVAEAMWRHDAAGQRWEGFSSAAPAASDLLTVNFLDAVWLCLPAPVSDSTTPAASGDQGPAPDSANTPPAGSNGQLPTPTPVSPGGGGSPPPGTVGSVVAPTNALASFSYSMEMLVEIEGESLPIRSSGVFKAPDSMSCTVTVSAGDFTFDMGNLVVIGSSAWLDIGLGWAPAAIDDPGVVENLELCPGSAVFWQRLGLPGDLGGVQGQLTTVNGIAAGQVSIAGLMQSLPGFGPILLPSEGAAIHAYDIWVAQDGSWVVALAFDATVSGEDGEALIQMRVDVTTPNDPSISVVPPM